MKPDPTSQWTGATEQCDGWWKAHFFEPLARMRSVVGPVYQDTPPPAKFWQARDFARQLWTCCDDADLKSLVQASADGAAEFAFLVSILGYEKLVGHPKGHPDNEAIPHKPFAILACVTLGWLDEVEALTPGKTTPAP